MAHRNSPVPCRSRTLAYWHDMDELQPGDFSARMTRRARSHGISRPTARRLLRRRLGVLAMAVAVPAMAAPGVREAVPGVAQTRSSAPAQAPVQPLDPEFAAWAPADGAPAVTLASGEQAATLVPGVDEASLTILALPDRGPSARAFTMGGSFTDKLRAEECLTMAVYYEAASESLDGQRAVAQVVMNRVRHPSYPNTVCGVVFQGSQRSTGCQFSFTCDGSLARRPSIAAWTKARRVASAALGGFVFAPVGLATHYHTTAIYPYWAASLTPVGTIGAHRFYRFGGPAGQSGAFTATYAGLEPLPVRSTSGAVTPLAGDLGVPALPLPVIAAGSAGGSGDAAALAPVVLPAPAAPATAPSQLLPQSGDVREEYAQSGRWLRQP